MLIEIQTNLKELNKDLEKFREIIGRIMADTLQGLTSELRYFYMALTPFVTGKLFHGWRKVVYSKGSPANEWVGEISNKVKYFKDVEEGQLPGRWVSISALKQWAAIKFGDENIAYPVRWKIFRKGTDGKFILKRNEENTGKLTKEYFDEAIIKLKDEWDRG